MKTRLYTALFLLFILFSVSPFCFSQSVDFIRKYSTFGTYYRTNHIIPTFDNGYVITGYKNNQIGSGVDNYFIAKTDSMGDTLWYREDNYPFFSEAKFVIETSDSCYIIGTTKSPIGLVKFDRNGNFLWEKNYNPIINWIPTSTFFFSPLLEKNEFLYAFGYLNIHGQVITNGVMMKLNLNGDSLMTLNNTQFICGGTIQAALNYDAGNIIISGFMYDSTLLKYQFEMSIIDTNGNVILSRIYPTVNNDQGFHVSEDTNRNFYFMSDPQKNIYKTDSVGNIIWHSQYATRYLSKIENNVLLLMDDNFVYYYLNDSGSMITSYVPFDLQFTTLPPHIGGIIHKGNKLIMGGSSATPVAMTGEWFIVQYDISNVIPGIKSAEQSGGLVIFPNPVLKEQNKIYVKSIGSEIKVLQIFDHVGKLIRSLSYSQNEQTVEIPLGDLSRGIYFIQVQTVDKKRFTRKIVVD